MKKIRILGMADCKKYESLALNTEKAAQELGLECKIEKTTDMDEILKSGFALMLPALYVDNKIKLLNRTASIEEIKDLLI